MSYFAVMLAQKHPEKLGLATDTDWLPILIRIRDLARQPNLNILDYVRQFSHNTLCVNPPLPPGFFEYWLEDGRALILLDGLDEVPEEGKRDEVVRYIENFLGQFERNRAIITSRPAGYRRDFFRTDEFPHYEVQPFDDAKIEEFINRWYDSRIKEDKPEAEGCKDSLRKALSDNARIKLLARNPLLLTIITLIHRYRAILPKQRHELYDKAVETLLKSWDAKRDLSHHKVLKYLELDDLRRLMESVAYWIHTQASTGDKEGGTLIDRDELIEQLSQEIKALKQIKPYEAKEEAKRFVNFIQERTGLFNEQGRDCYAFVHKTFQEYLCAQEIIYQADNEDDFDIILNHIQDHLHKPHWREVLLLLIAQQKPKKAARAIRKILNNGSEYEQWIHRDLLFAGSCLAENPKGLKGADNRLSEEILEQLAELEADKSEQVSSRVRWQVFQILCSLYETDYERQALQLLKDKANSLDEDRLLDYRAALGEKDTVTTTLLEKLQHESSSVRWRAANTLGKLDSASQTVVNVLLEKLQDEDSHVRFSAANTLGRLGSASQTVVSVLLEKLQDENSHVRSSAASALSNLGNASQTVVSVFLERLQDEDSHVRSSAASALVNWCTDSEQVVQKLVELLKDQVSGVRSSAARALGKLGDTSDEQVVQKLLELLKDQVSEVRSSAARALGELGDTSNEQVVQKLLELLKDQVSEVRSSAARALGELGDTSEPVLQGIVSLLKDEDYLTQQNQDREENFLRQQLQTSAAYVLGELGQDSETIFQELVLLLSSQDASIRCNTAYALGELAKESETVLQRLLLLLQDDSPMVRFRAAEALSKFKQESGLVVQSLLNLLKAQGGVMYCEADIVIGTIAVSYIAAEKLAELGKSSGEVAASVAQWISQHQDSEYVGNGIDALWDMVVGEQS
jgi:HEAT repeat protein